MKEAFTAQMFGVYGFGLLETLYMVIVSAIVSYIFGLPIGVLLVCTDKNGITPVPWLNAAVGFIVNIMRSIPFIILLVLVSPVTRAITGTTIGSTATIVPLVFSAAPYISRVVEQSLKEVDGGVIEAATSMGASPMQIITKVLLPESKPSLILGAALATITIIGYTAMAGFVGGGGLGTIAVNYGYYRYRTVIMIVTVVIIVALVQAFQELGLYLSSKFDRRKQ
ncbi:MAG TPA: ABC transporter permease [Clostridiales bacterium]|jgi:D-methionine transport system permease protein|nr:ABC transporter permease [Clostridiales bacterium]